MNETGPGHILPFRSHLHNCFPLDQNLRKIPQHPSPLEITPTFLKAFFYLTLFTAKITYKDTFRSYYFFIKS